MAVAKEKISIYLVFFSQEDFKNMPFLWLQPQSHLRSLVASASALFCLSHRHVAGWMWVQEECQVLYLDSHLLGK